MFLQRLEELLDRTRDVDFFIPDDAGLFQIDETLVRGALDLMEEIVELMRDLGAEYALQCADLPQTQASSAEDSAQIAIRPPTGRVAMTEIVELSRIASARLTEGVESVRDKLAAKSAQQVAEEIDSGLRAADRALIALESSVREHEGLPMRRRSWQSVQEALAVRGSYAELRRRVFNPRPADGSPADGSAAARGLAERLTSAAEEIGRLRTSEIYPYLRIGDRLELRRLQERIQSWRRDGGADENGRYLWTDLEGFARLLGEISRRQELREYDRKVVDELWDRLFEQPSYDRAPEDRPREESVRSPESSESALFAVARFGPDQVRMLRTLSGRDVELDLFVERLDPPKPESLAGLRPILSRLRRELERTEPPDELSTAP